MEEKIILHYVKREKTLFFKVKYVFVYDRIFLFILFTQLNIFTGMCFLSTHPLFMQVKL